MCELINFKTSGAIIRIGGAIKRIGKAHVAKYSADYILFGDASELDEEWTAIFRLPQVEKVNLFLRMHAYLSRIYGEENVIKNCSKLAEKIDKEIAKRQDGEV